MVAAKMHGGSAKDWTERDDDEKERKKTRERKEEENKNSNHMMVQEDLSIFLYFLRNSI